MMADDFKAYGRELAKNGYVPIPIKQGQKAPAVKNWTTTKVTPAQINHWLKQGLGTCGVGLRGGNLVAIDIDIDASESTVDNLVDWCFENIGDPMIRIGKAPKVALFYRTAEPFSRRDSAYYADSQHIEARSLDTQTVAFGIHPDTNQLYRWSSESTPLNTPLKDLPEITSQQIDELYEYLDELATYNHWPLQADSTGFVADSGDWMKGKYDIEDADLADALSHIEADDYHRWVSVGMGLYHQFDGGDEGLDLWDAWSSKANNYDGYDECERKWHTFKEHGKRRTVTLGTIINYATAAGWKNPGTSHNVPDEFPEQESTDPLAPFRIDEFLTTTPPPVNWLIKDFMPANKVCLLTAPGGTGKSFFTLQLAFSIATGTPLAGHWKDIEPGGVLLVSAEDDREDVHRRIHSIYETYTDDFAYSEKDLCDMQQAVKQRLFHISMVGKNARITHKNGNECELTSAVDKIIQFAMSIPGIKLIMLDPVSRFRGGNENDQEDVTRFVEALERIRTETGAAVMVVHHANKASMREGGAEQQYAARGASALTDGVRWQANMAVLHPDEAAKMGIKKDDAGHFVKLAVAKTNYTAPSGGVWLHRGQGGVLTSIEMDKISKTKSKEELADISASVINIVRRKYDEGEPITTRKLIDDYGGSAGEIGVARNAAIAHVDKLLSEGILTKEKSKKVGGGYTLKVTEKGYFDET